ncbi:Uncharacterized protein CTYZ_00002134 [Cryptosporidium tyzzeri]|nr:Uncharacterized protein CTYZ_00002134 [Cryptosporidium tyzzeri]
MNFNKYFLLVVTIIVYFNNLMFNNEEKLNASIASYNFNFPEIEDNSQNYIFFSQSFLNLSLKNNVSKGRLSDGGLNSNSRSRPSSTSRSRSVSSMGSTRPTGSTGSTGPAGPTRQTRSTGRTGPAGPTRQTRSTGRTSSTGSTGQTGSTGLTRQTRSTRRTSSTGSTGQTGSTGSTRQTRSTGRTGSTGPTRQTNPTGSAGSTRPAGPEERERNTTPENLSESYEEEVKRLQRIDIHHREKGLVLVTCQQLLELSEAISSLLDMFVTKASDLSSSTTLEECLAKLLGIKETKNLSLYPENKASSLLLKAIKKVSDALSSRNSFEKRLQELLLTTISSQDALSALLLDCIASVTQSISLSSLQYLMFTSLSTQLSTKIEGVASMNSHLATVNANFCDETFLTNMRYLVGSMKKKVRFKGVPSGSKAGKQISRKHSDKTTASRHYMTHTLSSSAKVRKKYNEDH